MAKEFGKSNSLYGSHPKNPWYTMIHWPFLDDGLKRGTRKALKGLLVYVTVCLFVCLLTSYRSQFWSRNLFFSLMCSLENGNNGFSSFVFKILMFNVFMIFFSCFPSYSLSVFVLAHVTPIDLKTQWSMFNTTISGPFFRNFIDCIDFLTWKFFYVGQGLSKHFYLQMYKPAHINLK